MTMDLRHDRFGCCPIEAFSGGVDMGDERRYERHLRRRRRRDGDEDRVLVGTEGELRLTSAT